VPVTIETTLSKWYAGCIGRSRSTLSQHTWSGPCQNIMQLTWIQTAWIRAKTWIVMRWLHNLPEVPGEEGQTEQTTQSADISWGGMTMHTLAKHVPLPMTTVYMLQEKYGAHDFLPCFWVFCYIHVHICGSRPDLIQDEILIIMDHRS
jgi:hypothetical protein